MFRVPLSSTLARQNQEPTILHPFIRLKGVYSDEDADADNDADDDADDESDDNAVLSVGLRVPGWAVVTEEYDGARPARYSLSYAIACGILR